MKRYLFEKIKTTKFQLIAIICASLYIVGLFIIQNITFKATEKEPLLFEPTSAMKNLATKVTTGLHINSFPKCDFNKNTFSLDGILWFRFPVGTESLQTIENFSLHNNVQTTWSYKSAPIIKLIDDDVLISYHIEMEFKAALGQELYPLGDHRLYIMFQNRSVTPYEIVFDCPSENFTLSKDLLVSNWSVSKTFCKTGYIRAPLTLKDSSLDVNYPCTVFAIDFQSMGYGDVMSLYFPMFVLFFIILLSLTINIVDITRLNLVAASVPILVLFRLVIVTDAPVTGYATQIDYVYYLLVFISLLILFFQTYVTLTTKHVAELAESKKMSLISRLETVNSFVILGALALLVIPLTYNTYLLLTFYSIY